MWISDYFLKKHVKKQYEAMSLMPDMQREAEPSTYSGRNVAKTSELEAHNEEVRQKMTSQSKEVTSQNMFKPLENFTPEEMWDDMMYMGNFGQNKEIYSYKHSLTRNYINIDTNGKFYNYANGQYNQIPKTAALDHVLGRDELAYNKEKFEKLVADMEKVEKYYKTSKNVITSNKSHKQDKSISMSK